MGNLPASLPECEISCTLLPSVFVLVLSQVVDPVVKGAARCARHVSSAVRDLLCVNNILGGLHGGG
eukprot:9493147-Pyramimonas_sp.AAC.1